MHSKAFAMGARLSTCVGMSQMMGLVTKKMLLRWADMLRLWMTTKMSDGEEWMVVV